MRRRRIGGPALSEPHRRRVAGFTLLELIIVVMILALIAALAVTRLDLAVPKYRLRGAVRQTASILQLARSRAAATGRDVYVRIYLSEGKYELLVPNQKEDQPWIPADTPEELIPPPQYEFQSVFQGTLPEILKASKPFGQSTSSSRAGPARAWS